MDILQIEILFASVSSAVYCYAMLIYSSSILGFRSELLRWIGALTTCSAGALYTSLTLFYVPIPVIYIMAFFIILFLFHMFLNGSWLQHVFAAGNFIFHIIFFRGITLTILSMITAENLYTIVGDKTMSSLSLGLAFTLSFVYLVFFFKRLYPLKNVVAVAQEPKYLKILSCSQAMLNILFVLGSTTYYFKKIDTWFSLYHLFAYILILIVFYILFDFCVKSDRLQEFQSAYHLYEQQLEKQVDAYATQEQYVQRMRKFKHDWISLKNTLVPMLETVSREELLSYLGQIDTVLCSLSSAHKEFSNNPLVQAILIHTEVLCQKYGIAFEATAIFPPDMPLGSLDLCRIFTNITNNAVEANDLLGVHTSRYIHISTAANLNWCTITCENSFNGAIQKNGDTYSSTKEDTCAHGFGIRNVVSASKHDVVQSDRKSVTLITSFFEALFMFMFQSAFLWQLF